MSKPDSMKCEIRLPADFKEYQGDVVVSNLDDSINPEIEAAIKTSPCFPAMLLTILTVLFGGMTN
ncbi:hypothetical protein LWM68_13770 [Niabella sp. W65]|nr:hypothetical protein [Niabella sp. W65]MCH7363722.1 hypothetical protein [Niabella sp. W65]ULT39633.1 hypothetical protein KRR40_32595 [Niabella sp. I65]